MCSSDLFPNIVVGNEHADAPFPQSLDDELDIVHGQRVYVGKRDVPGSQSC